MFVGTMNKHIRLDTRTAYLILLAAGCNCLPGYQTTSEDHENLTTIVVEQEGLPSDGWEISIIGFVGRKTRDSIYINVIQEGCSEQHLDSNIVVQSSGVLQAERTVMWNSTGCPWVAEGSSIQWETTVVTGSMTYEYTHDDIVFEFVDFRLSNGSSVEPETPYISSIVINGVYTAPLIDNGCR